MEACPVCGKRVRKAMLPPHVLECLRKQQEERESGASSSSGLPTSVEEEPEGRVVPVGGKARCSCCGMDHNAVDMSFPAVCLCSLLFPLPPTTGGAPPLLSFLVTSSAHPSLCAPVLARVYVRVCARVVFSSVCALCSPVCALMCVVWLTFFPLSQNCMHQFCQPCFSSQTMREARLPGGFPLRCFVTYCGMPLDRDTVEVLSLSIR